MTTSAPEVPTIGGPDEAKRAKRLALTERATYLVCAGLGALSLIVIALIAVFVFRKAWPAFSFNGIHFFGYQANPNLDQQLNYAFTGHPPGTPYETLRAFPAIYGTLLTTGGSILLGVPFSILAAIFIAELAPRRVGAVVGPVVRLLAAVPSVIWGLFGLLVIAPVIKNIFISTGLADEYVNVVPLQGQNVLLGTLVLTLMVAPFEIAIFTDALRSVPSHWTEGARALGMDRWRTVIKISLPVIRSAIVAGTVLATGRAIGEAIALSMTTGALAFVPNPLDGLTFLLEPVRPLASAIIDYSEGFSGEILAQNLFAFGALIMVSAFSLMLAARLLTHGRGKASGAF